MSVVVSAQEIEIRLSVKFICDGSGNPPTGHYTDPATWEAVIDQANSGNERFGRGYRYVGPDFDGNVYGASMYFDLSADQRCINGHPGLDLAGACDDDSDCDNDPVCEPGENDCENMCQDLNRRCTNGHSGVDGTGLCYSHGDCDDDPPCSSGEHDCDGYCMNKGTRLQFAARNHPGRFHWRDDAVNIYVTDVNSGTTHRPACRGWSTFPWDKLPTGETSAMVSLCARAGAGNVPAHEFGHFFGLVHTWETGRTFGDFAEDTPVDAVPGENCPPSDPYWSQWTVACVATGDAEDCCCQWANTRAKAEDEGWSEWILRIMLKNLMSYHCAKLDVELSEDQLDWYTTWANGERSNVCSGVTRFAGGSPLRAPPDAVSTYNPYYTIGAGIAAADPGGNDIVLIRPGLYSETGVFDKPVTLRATRAGLVIIGE
jgi:hypothetical protein